MALNIPGLKPQVTAADKQAENTDGLQGINANAVGEGAEQFSDPQVPTTRQAPVWDPQAPSTAFVSVDVDPWVYYKHKTIRNFSVHIYSFKNHICKIRASEEADLIEQLQGIHNSDKVQIVRLKSVENETPLSQLRGIRGATSTDRIPDRTRDQAATPIKTGSTNSF